MRSPRKIILASGSPSRKEILKRAGVEFEVETSDYEEDLEQELAPHELVKKLSQGKARAVAEEHDDAIIIGADSVVVIDGEVIGKPTDETDARAMLHSMSGRDHIFLTGYTIIDTENGKEITKTAETKARFKKLSEEEISAYAASGEPMGKAGAYALQGRGVLLVEKIEGEHSTIMGLPVSALAETLKEFGVNWIMA